MNTLFRFIMPLFTIVLLAGTVSCNKEDNRLINKPIGKTKAIRISAYRADNSSDTKTVLTGEEKRNVYWSPKEEINIFAFGESFKFTSLNEDIAEKIDFEGTIEGIDDPTQLDGYRVIGLYPYDENATCEWEEVVTTTLPEFQTAVEDNIADKLFISLGRTDKNATFMYFYNVCSGLCFSVEHDDIKQVTIRSMNEEEYLAGKFSVKFDYDYQSGEERPIVQEVIDGKRLVTVEAPNGGTFEPGKMYYAITLPTPTPGIIIEGLREDGSVYEHIVDYAYVEFRRSVFLRKREFDAGLEVQDLYTYYLDASYLPDFTYRGGDEKNAYTVTSYRELNSDPSIKIPVAWKTQISTDNGTTWNYLTKRNREDYNAEWFTLGSYSGVPKSENPQNCDLKVEWGEDVSISLEEIHNENLRNGVHPSGIDNSIKENAIDLSMYDVSGNPINQTTANCYIVNAPGWYKIPMVYGNAIKDGATNYPSFRTENTGATILSNFIDHTKSSITQPWVSKAYGITKAELVWHDAPSRYSPKPLIKDIEMSGDSEDLEEKYITFYINPNAIYQANALIAAYIGETIAWSWHIWVTDRDYSNPIEITNRYGVKYDVMQTSLGWCDTSSEEKYEERKAQLRIVQPIGNNYIDLELVQNSYESEYISGNCTFYQWGRKDPMIGSNYNYSVKDYYGATGIHKDKGAFSVDTAVTTPIFKRLTGDDVIATHIKNPSMWNSYWPKRLDDKYINLWSANTTVTTMNDDIVVKTIYDPSPTGYCLPAPNFATNFSTMSYNYHEYGGVMPVNGNPEFHEGYSFYTDDTHTSTIFFHASGQRAWSYGTANSVKYGGEYWLAGAYDKGNGHIFYFLPESLAVWGGNNGSYKNGGYSVRPVLEK